MKTKTFCELIERAYEQVDPNLAPHFETVPYSDNNGEVQHCLGLTMVRADIMAEVTAKAMHILWEDMMTDLNEDIDEAMNDFVTLVGTMRLAQWMNWECVYFPGLTEEQVLADAESGDDPLARGELGDNSENEIWGEGSTVPTNV